MRILLQRSDGKEAAWISDFAELLPQAEIHPWREGQATPDCDYAVVWQPPAAMLAELGKVKAIFNTGAGVDALLKFGEALPPHVPLVRLDDAGMGVQMAEYVSHAVLRHFRRFDDYEAQARAGIWQPLPAFDKHDFPVGVLGMGVLGKRVLDALAQFEFPLRGWSRSAKQVDGVDCFAGEDALEAFLRGTRVLVCLLPLTPETHNLLDRARLAMLLPGAYVINVARGAHLAEPDLLTLIRSGHIAGATLDVFRNEPLPQQHPFWQEPRITITPHVSATTLRRESVAQIAAKMRRLQAGELVAGIVNRLQGY
ncbi:glyoxylate/hydroxypyruvate reductase A [Janthinobacterium sp. PC23-8]|uniref:2-hydroxyacid dehydrogenase n=1 Tax=Janthinobacterium sp. PC23-8 TaxID=2012679 RepID=UPI000B9760D9|nr:glyoxylate/hydroxypyruvate reductase A [Janthinobacterium sp. PC23-8]OYO31463.1 glyoxylate/hydroxypyruvate reductase A [Janthinobacterium sp. PC23-8]